jgi:hypothetical protein
MPLCTPTLALPHQGGGIFFAFQYVLPFPLVGEGGVRGNCLCALEKKISLKKRHAAKSDGRLRAVIHGLAVI